MKTDVKKKDNTYEVAIDLPGFKKDEINSEKNLLLSTDNLILQQFFLFKINEFQNNCYYCNCNHCNISVFPLQLRHIYKIHPIPAGQKCKWQE